MRNFLTVILLLSFSIPLAALADRETGRRADHLSNDARSRPEIQPSRLRRPRVEEPIILGGVRTEDLNLRFKYSVAALTNFMADGKRKRCSATFLMGCLVTARHCLGIGNYIYAGTDMNRSGDHQYLAKNAEQRTLPGDSHADDIAVIKPDVRIPRELWQSLDVIPEEEFVGTVNSTRLGAIGWGDKGTDEEILPDGLWARRNVGSGVKRFGEVTFAGSGEGASAGTYKFNRANSSQALAPGDSGGPIFERDPLGGVKWVGVSQASLTRPVYKGEVAREHTSDDSVASYGVKLSKHRAWLARTIDELKCGQEPLPPTGTLENFVYENMGRNGATALETWKEDRAFYGGGKKLEELKRKILHRLLVEGKVFPPFDQKISLDLKTTSDGGLDLIWGTKLSDDDEEDAKLISAYFAAGRGTMRPIGTIKIPKAL